MLSWTQPGDAAEGAETPHDFRDAGLRCVERIRSDPALMCIPVVLYSVVENRDRLDPLTTVVAKSAHPDLLILTVRGLLAATGIQLPSTPGTRPTAAQKWETALLRIAAIVGASIILVGAASGAAGYLGDIWRALFGS